MKKRKADRTIAIDGDWVLVERTERSAGGWLSLHLSRKGRVKKRSWWLGWNGERLARNADTALLAEHEPERLRWLEQTLKEDRSWAN
jgi:hypothetical protein